MTQLSTRPNNNGALVAPGGFIPSYDLAGIQSASKILYESGMFSDVRSAAQACVKVMAGAELGIPPFASMNGIHIIKGKPTISAGIMAGKVKASGRYDFRVTENSDRAVEITFYQHGEEIGRSRFTIEDARRAETQNLTKFPRNMLYARAMSNGVKWFTPDIFLGPIYTPEEMGATVNDDGDVITVDRATGEVYEPRTQVQRRNSDPNPNAVKHERLDGTLVHAPVIDPATGRPATVQYRHEEQEEDKDFAPRSTAEQAANAAALKKGIGNHRGWMVARKLEPDNRALSLYLLCRADRVVNQRDDGEDRWTSRKQLTADDWTACNTTLAKLPVPVLNEWVAAFYDAIKREEAGATEDPFADSCIACGTTGPIGSCSCTVEAIHQARADAEGAAQSGTLLDVPPAENNNTAAFT